MNGVARRAVFSSNGEDAERWNERAGGLEMRLESGRQFRRRAGAKGCPSAAVWLDAGECFSLHLREPAR